MCGRRAQRPLALNCHRPAGEIGTARAGKRPPGASSYMREIASSFRLVACLGTALAALALLSSGTAWLEMRLPGGLPLGNALAAAALCALAALAMILSARRMLLRRFARMAMFAALSWLPVSLALSGNPDLNFGGTRGIAWLAFSVWVTAVVCCALVAAVLASALAWLRRGNTP